MSEHALSAPKILQLASKSPRRAELLSQIGVEFNVVSANVEEVYTPSETAVQYVQRLAREKSRGGYLLHPGMPTLGADTIGVLDDEVLEKPKNQEHAVSMLRRLSGRSHYVVSAIAITDETGTIEAMSATEVTFREIEEHEMQRYWQTQEPRDKAGGYGIQGYGAVFVKEIKGSYSAVVGLPIEVLVPLLQAVGVPYWPNCASKAR